MIILDSSFLVAYHNDRDAHHAASRDVMEHLIAGEWGRAILLEYVFLEVATVLLARRGLLTALTVADTLLRAREVDFIPCSDLFLDALHTFRTQASGKLSFTDAAIVALARNHSPGRVATFDADFVGLSGVSVVPAEGAG